MSKIKPTLRAHLEDSEPRIEFIEKMMKDFPKLTEDIASIRFATENLVVSVDALQHISIKNGNGLKVQYKRDDYYQMLYDRPSHALNDATGTVLKIGNVARALTWFFAFVGLIWKVFIPFFEHLK
jgi:hypothetical protein